jgi:hypothetical protein
MVREHKGECYINWMYNGLNPIRMGSSGYGKMVMKFRINEGDYFISRETISFHKSNKLIKSDLFWYA